MKMRKTSRTRTVVTALAAGAGCALLAAALAQAAPAGTPRVGPNVRMSAPQRPFPQGKLGRAAIAIAADAEGKRLVAAWETIEGSCGPPLKEACPPPKVPGLTAYGYSTDGGRTWTDAGAPPVVDGAMSGGHAWLDRGGVDGETFFFVNRARSVADGTQAGILFHRGHFKDGAFVWEEGKLLRPAKKGDVWRSTSVAATRDGSGKVYVAVSNLRELCGQPSLSLGQIEFLRSADEGRTWEGPVIVGPDTEVEPADPKDPRCGDQGSFQIATSQGLGPAGEIYLIWQFGPFVAHGLVYPMQVEQTGSVRFARSLDGGKTWSVPRDVATLNSLWEDPPLGYSKPNLLDFMRVAVAPGGPHKGRVYVAYPSAAAKVSSLPAEQSLVSSQVYLLHSDDRGETWSRPLPLGPPVPPAGVKRYRPTVAVEADGAVDVVYLESQERQLTANPDDRECTAPLTTREVRAGKLSSLTDLQWVRSADGGDRFGPPVRVSSESTNWCTTFYDTAGALFSNTGDYLGIFAAGHRAFAVWTDGRRSVPEAYFAALDGAGGR
jgi:hypothetical protein